MFIAALFSSATTWEQPRCTLVDEWINNLWYLWQLNIIQQWKEISYQAMKGHGGTLNKFIKGKKPVWKGHTLYDYNCMTFHKMQNNGHGIKISGCQGWEAGRWATRARRMFRAVETLQNNIVVDTCHYTFVQTHRRCNTKSEPQSDLGTLNMRYRCRCISVPLWGYRFKLFVLILFYYSRWWKLFYFKS